MEEVQVLIMSIFMSQRQKVLDAITEFEACRYLSKRSSSYTNKAVVVIAVSTEHFFTCRCMKKKTHHYFEIKKKSST